MKDHQRKVLMLLLLRLNAEYTTAPARLWRELSPDTTRATHYRLFVVPYV